VRTFFGQGGGAGSLGGGSHMRTSDLFGAKKRRIFRNLCCVRTDKEEEGVEPVRTFFG